MMVRNYCYATELTEIIKDVATLNTYNLVAVAILSLFRINDYFLTYISNNLTNCTYSYYGAYLAQFNTPHEIQTTIITQYIYRGKHDLSYISLLLATCRLKLHQIAWPVINLKQIPV